jgi:hypothetical protein
MSKFNVVFILLSLLLCVSAYAQTSSQLINRRIQLLESALSPASPQGVALTWAKSAKNRNGAVQYMLMCPDLQHKNLSNLESLNWVTGTSSPQISDFKLLTQQKTSNSWIFTIQFNFSMNNRRIGTDVEKITVIPSNSSDNSSQQFCISKFNHLSPVEGL